MNRLMQFFAYEHLPAHLQDISKPCGELAKQMDERLTESAEKTAGLRKLLESKDCFVRAVLEEQATREEQAATQELREKVASPPKGLVSPAHSKLAEQIEQKNTESKQ
jgi:N12 class adenine-specific DNA methylase